MQVNPRYHIPIRAISLVTGIIILLSLINIGSSTALNAIVSLSTLALYISYLIPIALLVAKRIRGDHITFGPFNLGRMGVATNVFALVFGVFICIFLPFPSVKPVTSVNMNYAGPVFALVLVFAVCDWVLRGRKIYTGPLREVSDGDRQMRGDTTIQSSTIHSI
jgi:choline transport protein